MPVIYLETFIEAPIERCFDLARNVDIHTKSAKGTDEKAIAGVTEGLLEVGDYVTWEATHLGVKQRLTAHITAMNKPDWFIDEMVSGAFHSFIHTHRFEEFDGVTLMIDQFIYKAPFGLVGSIANVLFLKRYMHRFLHTRAIALKDIAESS
ncbi:SRPBCC family protein [Alkalihalobacillus sp. CinArs1]|uniref:SRPBCC family protein n=1 Tax=Alkalihalobacillus sp. CinArs1 TaxID=2995314 RepID=UPI0022DCE9BF|nr:SRPBCC family protein [Alkalihalobacillus sp. CinArs1]